jgi:RNA polymerase sigma factor (sigma-70 family)
MEPLALSLPSSLAPMTASQQDRQIAEAVRQQRPRLLQFIRRRIPDEAEAEDLLQDVFAELVESYRLLKPVEQAAAWLFRVARNRITDLYRRKRPVSLEAAFGAAEASDDGEGLLLADLLPAPDDSRNPPGSPQRGPGRAAGRPAPGVCVARAGRQNLPRNGRGNRRAAQNPYFAQALRRAAPAQAAAKALYRIIHRLDQYARYADVKM